MSITRQPDDKIDNIPFYQYPIKLKDVEERKRIYSNLKISKETVRILKRALSDPEAKKGEGARFAIYLMIDIAKKESKIWFYPTLPSYADEKEVQKKQKHYNLTQNVVIKADRQSTGVVHLDAKDFAIIEMNQLGAAPKKIKFEIGLSAFFNMSGVMVLHNRSTMQFTIQSIHELPSACFTFKPNKFFYDKEKRNFRAKKGLKSRDLTCVYTLARSLANNESQYILSALNDILNKCLDTKIKVHFDKDISNFEYENMWKKRTTAQVKEWLLESIYIAAFLPNEPQGQYFTLQTDTEIASEILQAATKYNFPIDLNQIPKNFSSDTRSPLILFVVRKNDYHFLKLCISNGADITIADEYGKNAWDYAKEALPTIKKYHPISEATVQKIFKTCNKNKKETLSFINSLELDLREFPCSAYFDQLREEIIQEESDLVEISHIISKISESITSAKKIYKLLQDLKDLFVAITSNDSTSCLQKLNSLREDKINLDKLVLEGCNLLSLAINSKRIDIVKVLIDFGLNLNLEDKKNGLPLLYALKSKQPTIAKLILDQPLAAIDSVDKNPLFLAIKLKDYNLVKQILEHKTMKVDPNVSHLKTGITPLLYAINSESFDIAILLIQHKANINQRRASKWESPIELAKQKTGDGAKEFVSYLEELGAQDNSYIGKKRPVSPIK